MFSPSRAAFAAAALVTLHLAASAANAAPKCMSKSEARAVYRTSYLYYRSDSGRRCWSNQRNSSRRMEAKPDRAASALARSGDGRDVRLLPLLPEPMPFVVPPAGMMPPYQDTPPEPRSLLDEPRWRWIATARAADRPDDPPGAVIYSTFAGEPPDTWPQLEAPSRPDLALFLIIGTFAAMAGLALWTLPYRIANPQRDDADQQQDRDNDADVD